MGISEPHLLLRRQVVLAGLAGPLFLPVRRTRAVEAAADLSDPVQFVAALYASEGHTTPAAAPLAQPLKALWDRLRTTPLPDGYGIHAWYGRGLVPPGDGRVDTIQLQSRTENAAQVEAVVFVRGARRVIGFDLVRSGTSWLVANVKYPDDDLDAFLKRAIAEYGPGAR
jgi:hypothetical protein